MLTSIEQLAANIEALDTIGSSPLQRILADFDVDDAWVASQIPANPPPRGYCRTVLCAGSNFELVLAVWPRRGRTAIHDHGQSHSGGAALVLRGNLFNQTYQLSPDGGLAPASRWVHSAREIIPIPKGLIHAMGHNAGGETAVSLHVYSPAIVNPSYWDSKTLLPLAN